MVKISNENHQNFEEVERVEDSLDFERDTDEDEDKEIFEEVKIVEDSLDFKRDLDEDNEGFEIARA